MPSVSALLLIALSGAAAVASSDPTNIASYPPCVVSHPVYPLCPAKCSIGTIRSKELTITTNQQKCQTALLPSTGCGSLSNRTCVCKLTAGSQLNICEEQTCSASDFGSMMNSPFLLWHWLELATSVPEALTLCPGSSPKSRIRSLQPGRRHWE